MLFNIQPSENENRIRKRKTASDTMPFKQKLTASMSFTTSHVGYGSIYPRSIDKKDMKLFNGFLLSSRLEDT